MTVSLGQNNTILVHLVEPAPKPTPAERIGLKYKLVPFSNPEAEAPAPKPAPKPPQSGKKPKP